MKSLKNMKIGRKLTVGFMIVAIMAAIIGAVGIVGMMQINKADTKLYEEQTKPLEDMFSLVKSLYQMRVELRTAVINYENADNIKTCEENFNVLVETYNTSVENYGPTIVSDETKALFNEASELFNNSFLPVASETFRIAKLGDMSGAHNAGAASTNDINKMFTNYDQCLKSRINNAKTTSESNNKLFFVMSIVLAAVIIVGIAISIILGIYISRIISRPINKMVEAADEISLGNTEIDVEVESEDETGMLAGSFNRMIGGIKEQVKIVAAVADGDLTVNITPRSGKDTMGIALEKTIKQLNDIFNDINHASVQVSIGSEQVSNGAQALSQGATEQASSIEELSASITEISAQVNENAENVRLATDYVEQAGAGVEKSNNQMKEMLVAMSDINNSSNEISKIIKVIDDIAFQTNILALNAAVEAARAGSAGKGFAVVADEVRNLASKSADAAKQTTALIESSIKTVGSGAKIAEETAVSLAEVAVNAKLVNDSMEKISSASADQAAAITQVNTGIEQISSVIQTNSATAEESAAYSEELSSQANLLKQQIAVFKIKEDKET